MDSDLNPRGRELSIIIPTFNESANVTELVERLRTLFASCRWEVIFVDDDSPDKTAQLVREIGQGDSRVRCVHRIGRRGLSSACVEGMLASSAPYLAVMDGDLQHDETLLPRMLSLLKDDELDIVVGTRYAPGAGLGDWDKSRAALSALATRLSHVVLKVELSDPMSGFFMLRRETLELCLRHLSGIGFKILVDLFASSPGPLRFKEIPYQFRTRKAGESKLDTQAAWDYLMLLTDKLVGRFIPAQFISFSLVGGVGVIIHVAVLALLFNQFGVKFLPSQATAAIIAMTSNFALNNVLTYRDRRLRGWRWLRGLILFIATCSLGALANVGIASYLFSMDTQWVLAGLAGIVVGTGWNYSATRAYTWKQT